MKKEKIIFYLDWTDCLAHLTGDDAYAEGENKKEKEEYTRNQRERFFTALKQLQKKYDVDIHCVTGGSQEYLNGLNGGGWIDQLNKLFIDNVGLGVFKSVITEYGCDMLTFDGEKTKLIENPFPLSSVLNTKQLEDNIKKSIPEEIKENVVVSRYKYFGNIRFEDPEMTEDQFNYYYSIIKEFQGNENYTLYPYYFPGYGVEIDVLPTGINKGRGIDFINEIFYKNTPREEIALSVFNGDFPEGIDLIMADHALTNDVVYVASDYAADYVPTLDKDAAELPYSIGPYKIATISAFMEILSNEEKYNLDLSQHPFDKGNYKHSRAL